MLVESATGAASGPAIAISVIVPVRDDAANLAICLAAIRREAECRENVELIVVDDGSVDDSADVARRSGARVLRHERSRGAGAARNTGAHRAAGATLLFVDADVAIGPGVLSGFETAIALDPGRAVIGSYDDRPGGDSRVSRYRNLLHHHTHQRGAGPVSHFWTGLGAVRRADFLRVGGFPEDPTVLEDVALGYRLHAVGRGIRLVPELQGRHLKRWTLTSMLRTDAQLRARPWVRLMAETRAVPGDLSLAGSARASASMVVMALAGAVGALLVPVLAILPVLALGAFAALNTALWRLLWRRGGGGLVLAGFPLHVLHHAAGVTGLVLGLFDLARAGTTSSGLVADVSAPVGLDVRRSA